MYLTRKETHPEYGSIYLRGKSCHLAPVLPHYFFFYHYRIRVHYYLLRILPKTWSYNLKKIKYKIQRKYLRGKFGLQHTVVLKYFEASNLTYRKVMFKKKDRI